MTRLYNVHVLSIRIIFPSWFQILVLQAHVPRSFMELTKFADYESLFLLISRFRVISRIDLARA